MSDQQTNSTAFNPDNLYREENYSDRTVGHLRRLVPVNKDGSDDTSREVVFLGQTQVMTQMGVLPLTFEIPAASLEEACQGFSAGVQKAYNDMVEEMEAMQREKSSIIAPPQDKQIII